MTTFFDTSAVIALSDPSDAHHQWSQSEFNNRMIADGPVIISDIVYAEISAAHPDKSDVDKIVQRFGFQRSSPTDAALHNAGQRYRKYKKNDGQKTNVLPDFFIGADALELGATLVTANVKDFRNFFHGLVVSHPDGIETIMDPEKAA